jgi:Asp-tRNA(Asn)/Glu-tRNA(Gln) amidotransferase A subunit family amidase
VVVGLAHGRRVRVTAWFTWVIASTNWPDLHGQGCCPSLGSDRRRDTHDATSVAVAVPDYVVAIESPVKGLKIGLPRQYFKAGITPEVNARIQAGPEAA